MDITCVYTSFYGFICVALTQDICVTSDVIRTIGLYRQNAIAIQNEGDDSIRGNVHYVTMQITLPIPEFTRNERNFQCDVLHITPDRVVTLILDDAISAIQTSR